jgi:hypothetical protein
VTVSEVRLAGLTFNSGPDSDGDEFIISDVEGWDGPGVEQITVERPISDGALVVLGRQTARTLVLTGWVVAVPENMGRARRKLAAAMASIVGTDGALAVDEEDGTYALSVRLLQGLRTKQAGPLAITFEATLLAADPTKTLVSSS